MQKIVFDSDLQARFELFTLRAVEEIEMRLDLSPHTEGESRDEPERVLIVGPLSARYEVFESEQVVLIYSVVYYPRIQT